MNQKEFIDILKTFLENALKQLASLNDKTFIANWKLLRISHDGNFSLFNNVHQIQTDLTDYVECPFTNAKQYPTWDKEKLKKYVEALGFTGVIQIVVYQKAIYNHLIVKQILFDYTKDEK